MRIQKIIIVLALCAFAKVDAQDIQRLDSFFNAIMINNKSMGSVAISQDGKLIYQRTIGNAETWRGKDLPASRETAYRIGSITKMFTAVMVLQAIESGKLNLESRLSAWYPTIPNASKISIKQMLGHRSGIHSFTDDENYLSWAGKSKTNKELIDLIISGKPEFEPGVKSSYSNSNFVLLGYILEKISGKSYQDLLHSNILAKLNLKETFFPTRGGRIPREAQSFIRTDKWVLHDSTDMSIPGGAGSIVSTPADLVKFIEGLFAGKLISTESLKLMQTIEDGYGLGMFQIPFYDKKAFGHSGGIDAFTSMLGYFPNEKLAIAYTSNGNGGMSTNDVIIGVLSIYFKMPFVIPDFKTVIIKPALLQELEGEYSSNDIPLKITVKANEGKLVAQATGQSSFPLDAINADEYKFPPAGIQMNFNRVDKTMTLRQGGKTYTFKK